MLGERSGSLCIKYAYPQWLLLSLRQWLYFCLPLFFVTLTILSNYFPAVGVYCFYSPKIKKTKKLSYSNACGSEVDRKIYCSSERRYSHR